MNIHDIAKLAGVSASTVSKVMNGKDRDISEDTKKKVRKTIEEENYVPYFKFREKEGLKTHLIGLIIREDNRERDRMVNSAARQAEKAGYHLIVSYALTKEEIQKCTEEMEKKKVSGVLIDSASYVSCKRLEQKTVYLGQTQNFDEKCKIIFYYRMAEAGRIAADKLMDAGHQKIACIVFERDKEILDGYKEAMHSRNFPIQPVWIYEGKTVEDIEKYGIRQVLGDNVTAIICGSQEIAFCVWKLMERTHTNIPDDLSMTVIGDEEILKILGNGISTVTFPADKMTKDAVDYLINMIEETKNAELMRKFTPVFIERGSIVEPALEKQGEKIIVVGSMNMDVTMEVSRIPVNDETQLAEKMLVFPGGKGGNQAVGAGKLGGQVYMIGCLGNDMDGKQLYTSLVENHVHMDGVIFDPVVSSGKAYISVDKKGESTIVVYQGANRNLSISQINNCKFLFESAAYCLLSMEIPDEIIEYTIRFCKRNNTEVILKPSAKEKIKEELLESITYFVPNEKELNMLIPGKRSLEEKTKILLEKGVKHVIVTRGSKGCYFRSGKISQYFSGSGFAPVDTTGGADSFISALAVCLSEGKPIEWAIRFAIIASGITVTQYGVQPALPDRKEVSVYEDEIFSKYNLYEKGGKEEKEE